MATPSFGNSFWGSKGFEFLNTYFKNAFKDMLFYCDFLQNETNCQYESAHNCLKIKKHFEQYNEQAPQFHSSFVQLKNEIETRTNIHNIYVSHLKTISSALTMQYKDLRKKSKGYLNNAEKLTNEYQQLLDMITKSKSKFLKAKLDVESLDNKLKAGAEPKAQTKLQATKQKLTHALVFATQDYKNCINRLSAFLPQYKENYGAACDALQNIENIRRVVINESLKMRLQRMQDYESQFPEILAATNKVLSSTDITKDLTDFIANNVVCNITPAPAVLEDNETVNLDSTPSSSSLTSNESRHMLKDSKTSLVKPLTSVEAALPPIEMLPHNIETTTTYNNKYNEPQDSLESLHETNSSTDFALSDVPMDEPEYLNEEAQLFRASWSYDAIESNEISFAEGEYVTVIRKSKFGWWVGTNEKGQYGLFPSNFLDPEPISNE